MRWSNTHIATKRDNPSDTEIISDTLLVKAGFIKKLSNGIYTYQNIALRVLNKIKNIIRNVLDENNCVEVLMPMVQPRSMWDETDRWNLMGKSLLKFKNRNDQEFCLAPTHEEVVTDLIRSDIKSYKNLPKNIYHIQTKYRDEIRPRFGLMRCREFIMKDAYSFDVDKDKALTSYNNMYESYKKIFDRVGLKYKIVEADTGNIGGSSSHEFHAIADAGEDAIMLCKNHAYNLEIAPIGKPIIKDNRTGMLNIESFDTPGIRSISELSKFLKANNSVLAKSMFFYDAKKNPILVLLKGSDEVNTLKLKKLLNGDVEFMSDTGIEKLTGTKPGNCGPVGLKGVKVYLDYSMQNVTNFIVGANKTDVHLKNVNYKRDFDIEGFFDLRCAKKDDSCPVCNTKYEIKRGIEVGHIFYLGTKYSKSMNATFLDQNQKTCFFEMGCYGIGVSRTMQAVVEQNHDEHGIIWPMTISPYQVHICNLDIKIKSVNETIDHIYQQLESLGIETLLDDRNERPGVKFNDADLLGIPYRINIGKKLLTQNNVEVIERKTLSKKLINVDNIIEYIKNQQIYL